MPDEIFWVHSILRTKIPEKNVQRAITPKIPKIELWFLYNACLLNEIYPLVKFAVDISNNSGDMLRTKMWDGMTDGDYYHIPRRLFGGG